MKQSHQQVSYMILILCCISLSVYASAKQDYQFITMEFAPYNYVEKGQLKGICTDIFKAALKRIGQQEKIRVFPLVRAYKMLEKKDNIILFSRLRTPNREKTNKWVGPLMPFRLVLYARKKSGIKISDIESAKNFRVGCSRDSIGHRLLKKHGFTQIDHLANGTINAKKLEKRRIDLWMTSDLVGKYGSIKQNVDPNQFEIVYVFKPTYSLYIAFSNNIPDNVVTKWQKVLNKLKTEGECARIVNRYLKKLNLICKKQPENSSPLSCN